MSFQVKQGLPAKPSYLRNHQQQVSAIS